MAQSSSAMGQIGAIDEKGTWSGIITAVAGVTTDAVPVTAMKVIVEVQETVQR